MRLNRGGAAAAAIGGGGRMILVFVLCCICTIISTTYAYPAYLLDPDEGCAKKLEVGFEMMAKPAIMDTRKGSTPIKVGR